MRPANEGTSTGAEKRYTGVRRRKWGKWVSEIRVPTTRTRLWLGSYSTPEAAAVAHDAAVFCLRGPSSIDDLNFPSCIPASAHTNLSPTSIQQVATAAGMDVDARLTARFARDISSSRAEGVPWTEQDGSVKWPMPDQVALENSGESGSMVVNSAMPERLQYQGPETYPHLLAVNEDDKGSKFRGGESSTLFIDDIDSWNFDDMDLRN